MDKNPRSPATCCSWPSFRAPTRGTIYHLVGLSRAILSLSFVPEHMDSPLLHRLIAFEHHVPTAGFLTTPHAHCLAYSLPEPYSLVHLIQWVGSLVPYIEVIEVAQCIACIKPLRPQGRIVLLGHSTRCQDVLHNLTPAGERPRVDGAIFQASASDQEATATSFPPTRHI